MKFTLFQKILLWVNIAVILGFGWHYGRTLNFEFLLYIGSIALIIWALFGTLKYTKFSNTILTGVTIWAVMHMVGGTLVVGDGVLYTYRFYPFFDGGGEFYILKFDQVIHMFLYGVVGLMFLHLLRNIIVTKKHLWLVAIIAILAATGVGGINEIIEFFAVVIFPETGVGGYYNTLLDIIFNFAGATLAVVGYLFVGKFRKI